MESSQAEGHLPAETGERGSYFQFTVVDKVHYLIKEGNKCTHQIFPLRWHTLSRDKSSSPSP